MRWLILPECAGLVLLLSSNTLAKPAFEIKDVVFEGGIAVDGRTGQKTCLEEESESLLCLPDPWGSICTREIQSETANTSTRQKVEARSITDLRSLRPKVEEVFQQVLKSYSNVIDRTFSSADAGFLNRILTECFLDFDFDESGEGSGLNAESRPPGSLGYQRDIWIQEKSCGVRLTPEAWRACANKDPLCFFSLFHEAGHYLNSCNFTVATHAPGSYFGPVIPWQRVVKNPSNAFASDFQVDKAYLGYLGEGLFRRTECLKDISDPKMGNQKSSELSSLHPGKKMPPFPPDTWISRCNVNSTELAQWDEAEADFWGATALADYMKQIPAKLVTPTFISAMLSQCLNAGPSKSRENDPHQEWSRRFNRNFLRNYDLRSVIGCHADFETAALCSPISGIHVYIPH
ncbi:MAG: hypothetical protein ACXWPM_06020 [Bdellovibrionota bacterium]